MTSQEALQILNLAQVPSTTQELADIARTCTQRLVSQLQYGRGNKNNVLQEMAEVSEAYTVLTGIVGTPRPAAKPQNASAHSAPHVSPDGAVCSQSVATQHHPGGASSKRVAPKIIHTKRLVTAAVIGCVVLTGIAAAVTMGMLTWRETNSATLQTSGPQEPTPCNVQYLSFPPADILIDGKEIGVQAPSPRMYAVAPGVHTVTFRASSGNAMLQGRYLFESGKQLVFMADLLDQNLSLEARGDKTP